MDHNRLIPARWGSEWTESEFISFHIVIKDTDGKHFFGSLVQEVNLKSMVPLSALTASASMSYQQTMMLTIL